MIFELASVWSYFETTERIDDSILRAAKAVTARLEVGARPASVWERAILAGYAAWRELCANEGGRVIVNLDNRTLEYMPLEV